MVNEFQYKFNDFTRFELLYVWYTNNSVVMEV